jgi:hypothetical protein
MVLSCSERFLTDLTSLFIIYLRYWKLTSGIGNACHGLFTSSYSGSIQIRRLGIHNDNFQILVCVLLQWFTLSCSFIILLYI